MNAIPPGGLTPEEPLVRPSAARRTGKAGAGQVQSMVALEEDPTELSGAVMLEDTDDNAAPEQPQPSAIADQKAAEPIMLEDEPEQPPAAEAGAAGAAASAGRSAGDDDPSSSNRPTNPRESSDRMATTHPDASERPTARSAGMPAPDLESLADLPTDPHTNPSVAQQPRHWTDAPAAPVAHSPVGTATQHHPTSFTRPQPEARPRDFGVAVAAHRAPEGSADSSLPRSAPWPTGRPAEPTPAATSGWDRPPPPPRHASRASALPTASLGMPAQLTSIEVTLSVEIGSHRLSLRDLLSVEPGQLVPLDRMTSEPVDILVNGKPFARGEVVAIGDRFGVRLTELVDGNESR